MASRKDENRSELEAKQQRAVRPKHPHAQNVCDPLFEGNDFFDRSDLVQVKYEMLRHVRVDGQSVVAAAQGAGMTRPSYYEAQIQFAQHGLPGLLPKKRGPQHAHKMSPEIMKFIEQLAVAEPGLPTPELQRRVAAGFGVSLHRRTLERSRGGKKNII